MYDIHCDLCKKHKTIKEYGGRILLWDQAGFDAMYAGRLCIDCQTRLYRLLHATVINPELQRQCLDYFGLSIE